MCRGAHVPPPPLCTTAVCASHPKNTQSKVTFAGGFATEGTVTAVAECPCESEDGLWWETGSATTPSLTRSPQYPFLDIEFSYAVS
jgi:hypothetical protein